ncbi:MAG: hypothetical protein IIB00_09445 [candidate division Zixibacteria bacterium]|nr:hypothetical protein [candidate division Zixibacteria bacterium]
MRLVSKITLAIILLFVVALVSYLQTDLREKKISKLVTAKTQEKLSSGYNAPPLMGADSVYDPNVIPGPDNIQEIIAKSETKFQSTPTIAGSSESNLKSVAANEASSNSEAKIVGEERPDDKSEIVKESQREIRPPTIMALTAEGKHSEEESRGISEIDTALAITNSGRVSGRDGEILKALNARLKRLPGDLSDYEKRVTIAEIRDDICEDFSITSAELDSILALSKGDENLDLQ